eukprot:TRINITY_DN8014_c0_g1_i1.p1 TRINITY_DN8014_c0_g1~~TRINITY_DN8014_c0_g1_i1.p1  ORF type:complete len:841 (+),score=172.71 TRINITY_DN8014_c0_g1_i1:108-2630(+)
MEEQAPLASPGQCSTTRADSETSTAAVYFGMPGAGSSLDQQMGWIRQKVETLEDQVHVACRGRREAEQRALRQLSEQVDRLWQELADERRDRQVEANEERLQRVAEVADIRDGIIRNSKVQARHDHPYQDGDEPPALETFVEEPEGSDEPEDEHAPELTAVEEEEEDGSCTKSSGGGRRRDTMGSVASSEARSLLSATRHAEAQLKRAAADARRAEGMVRREVARAVAEARAYLEENSQHQQELWAARRGVAASGSQQGSSSASVECLGLRLDSLEMHLRARLEATERGIDSIQRTIDNAQNMPAQVESLIQDEIEHVRGEVQAALDKERRHAQGRAQAFARDLSAEIERSVIDQAVIEIRAEVQSSLNLMREELLRARSDEASRQNMRISALSERMASLETLSSRTRAPDDGSSTGESSHVPSAPGSLNPDPAPALALQQFGESVAQLESTIGGLLRRSDEHKSEVQADTQRLKKEVDEISKRLSRFTTADLADLQQRFEMVEGKVAGLEGASAASGSGAARLREAKVMDEHSELAKSTRRFVADFLMRLTSDDPAALQLLRAEMPEIAQALDERRARSASLRAGERKRSPELRTAATATSAVVGPGYVASPPGHSTPSWSSPPQQQRGAGSSTVPPAGAAPPHGSFPAQLQRRLPEPSASPPVPAGTVYGGSTAQHQQEAVLQPAWSAGMQHPAAPLPGQPYSTVQRSWSVPMLRAVQEKSAMNATVKVMPPGSQAPVASCATTATPTGSSQSGVTSASYGGSSLVAPSSSTAPAAGGPQLRPSSLSRHVSPKRQPAPQSSSASRPQQKPTDSPYMRYRPVKLQGSSVTLPGHPVVRR